ncbi:MAG TPA: MFS transporter [Anaerolineales bacterium]|nr:MFS transporter [Anaerolineales bacterium]
MDSLDASYPASLKRLALLATTAGSFLTPFLGSAVNVALPAIGAEFAMNAVQLSWVATAFLLAAAVFLVPLGKLADIHGQKKIFLAGMLLHLVSAISMLQVASANWLIALRAIQGIGSAMIFGTSVAILTSVYPPGERGRALGINVASVYTGLSSGPFLGGLLTQSFGWRSIFLASALLSAAIILLTLWKLGDEWAGARGEKFDLPGSLLYALMLVAVMYGLAQLPSLLGAGLIVSGSLLLLVFIRWESRLESPVLNMRLFRQNRVFALSNLAALINYSATYAVSFLLSLYLQYIQGLPPHRAGLVLVAQPAMQAMFSPLAGRLSDRVESRVVASTGMALIALGLGGLAFLGAETPLALIVPLLMLLGFGFALFSSPNTNAVMGSVERRFYGVASATLGTMRLSGQMFSLGIAMLIFAVVIGRVPITPQYYPAFILSVRVAFAIFAVLCFGGIFASLSRGKLHA